MRCPAEHLKERGLQLNYKDWAWANIGSRSIEASVYKGLNDKHLQLEENAAIMCTSSTTHLSEMAIIIDKWLCKEMNALQLAKQHDNVTIS